MSEPETKHGRYRSGQTVPQKTFRIGDVGENGDAIGNIIVRLFFEPSDRVLWVNFEAFEVNSQEFNNGKFGVEKFERLDSTGSMDDTEDLEEAEPLLHGFVKWDGCTQFDWSSIHIDHKTTSIACLLRAQRCAGSARWRWLRTR